MVLPFLAPLAVKMLAPSLMGVLASKAPKLVRMMTGSEIAGAVTEKAVEVFSKATGLDPTDPEQGAEIAQRMQSDPDLAKKIALQLDQLEAQAFEQILADRQDARARDVALQTQAGGNRRADMIVIALFALLALCLAGTVFLAFGGMDPAVSQIVVPVLTGALGFLYKSVSDVVAFEFGSSRGSKAKTIQIDGLIAAARSQSPAPKRRPSGGMEPVRSPGD